MDQINLKIKKQAIPEKTSPSIVSQLETKNETNFKSLQTIGYEPKVKETENLLLPQERENLTGIGDTGSSGHDLLSNNIDQCSNLVQKHSKCNNSFVPIKPLDKEL